MSKVDGIEVKQSPLGGRGVFAVKAFAPGEVLLSLDRPLIALLDKSRIEDTCSWCFAWTELPILSGTGVNQAAKVYSCTGCKKVKYCSKKCQSLAWKSTHKRECEIFAAHPVHMSPTLVVTMRGIQGLNSGEARYKAILSMQSHLDDFESADGKEWKTTQPMAREVMKLLGKSENTQNIEQARSLICIIRCNACNLVTPTFDPLGMALDPLVSKINHSCSPNAVTTFDGPRVTVRALNGIERGEEIFISYIDYTLPFGLRKAELEHRYFFSCTCTKCKLGLKAPQDAFLTAGPRLDAVIEEFKELIPEFKNHWGWQMNGLGESELEQKLSALQFHVIAQLGSTTVDIETGDLDRLREAIAMCRNSGVFPLTRAPLPALYQQYSVACLAEKRWNEALIAMLRMYVAIDTVIYPRRHDPVRVVHGWALATLAKAVGSDQDTPFCKAMQSYGIDLSLLFLALLIETREQMSKSHGADSRFGRHVEIISDAMMKPGGEVDVQYSERGVGRTQWQQLLKDQVKDLMPKVRQFAEDETIALQFDLAMERGMFDDTSFDSC